MRTSEAPATSNLTGGAAMFAARAMSESESFRFAFEETKPANIPPTMQVAIVTISVSKPYIIKKLQNSQVTKLSCEFSCQNCLNSNTSRYLVTNLDTFSSKISNLMEIVRKIEKNYYYETASPA